jgi:hypothetical protein
MDQNQTYTFDILKRHITKGVIEQLPNRLVMKLWGILDDFLANQTPKDYLQVFAISIGKNTISIKHFQEVPPYYKFHTLGMEFISDFQDPKQDRAFKVYIIDDITHSTMLLAEEY